jgi:hypothetical protein
MTTRPVRSMKAVPPRSPSMGKSLRGSRVCALARATKKADAMRRKRSERN